MGNSNVKTFDSGIMYNAKLKDVKANIKRLKELNFNLSNVSKKVNALDKDVKNRLKDISDSDKIEIIYTAAIEQLKNINSNLICEYEEYYKINNTYTEIVEKLKNADEKNVEEITLETKKILEELRTSTTIDFEIEKKLVHSIYELVYQVIKLELTYKNKSILLESIKEDEVNAAYVAELVRDDIKNIKEGKDEINELLSKMDKFGLNSTYLLNSNLISLLYLYNNNGLLDDIKAKFLKKVDETSQEKYTKQLNEIKNNMDYLEYKISNLEEQEEYVISESKTRKSMVTFCSCIVACSVLGSIFLPKLWSKTKYYQTTTTTYDSSNNEYQTSQEYEKSSSDEILLDEYSVWDNPSNFRKQYVRNVYHYDLSQLNIDYDDISKYLTESHKNDMRYAQEIQTSDRIPEDYNYTEDKYVITKKTVNLDEYQYQLSIAKWIASSFMLAIISLIIDCIVIYETKTFLKETTSLEDLECKKENIIKQLQEKQKRLQEYESQIIELNKKYEEVPQELMNEYYSLPLILMKSKEVEKAKTLINKMLEKQI